MRLHGFHSNLSKCELWWPAEPPQDFKASYPVDLTQVYIKGTLVLNEPAGSTQFCERKFTEKVRSIEPVLDDVAALENTHVSFNLLKFCLGVCKFNYQLRVTPPESTFTGAKLFDGLIQNALDGSWVSHWTQLFSKSCSSQLPLVLTIHIMVSGSLRPQTQSQTQPRPRLYCVLCGL